MLTAEKATIRNGFYASSLAKSGRARPPDAARRRRRHRSPLLARKSAYQDCGVQTSSTSSPLRRQSAPHGRTQIPKFLKMHAGTDKASAIRRTTNDKLPKTTQFRERLCLSTLTRRYERVRMVGSWCKVIRTVVHPTAYIFEQSRHQHLRTNTDTLGGQWRQWSSSQKIILTENSSKIGNQWGSLTESQTSLQSLEEARGIFNLNKYVRRSFRSLGKSWRIWARSLELCYEVSKESWTVMNVSRRVFKTPNTV